MNKRLDREQTAELYNLFHLARTALAGEEYLKQTRYHRKLWATARFLEKHPGFTSKEVYLTFERADAGLI